MSDAIDLSELLPPLEAEVKAVSLEPEPAVKHSRKEHDVYDTDPACALACVEWLATNGAKDPCRKSPTVLDPCGGSGPFVAAARRVWPSALIYASDIRPETEEPLRAAGANVVSIEDFRALPLNFVAEMDVTVTNPTFVLAEELIRRWHAGARDGAVLALLLNCTFMAGQDRWSDSGLYMIAPPLSIAAIVPRPAFLVINGKKTSGKFEAALFTWIKGYTGEAKWLPPVRWTPERKTRKKRESKA